MMEIERKFLVSGDFRSRASSSSRMVQGYVCSASGRTVRVRIAGDRAWLTIKGPSRGISRFEWEKEIPVEEGLMLMDLCEPGVIDKTRFLVEEGGFLWEVDEFHADNEGLVVAEIELSDAGESFPRPDWLGKEVSTDRRYYNSSLCSNPYKNWKDEI